MGEGELAGRAILVTGASSGVGRYLATDLAQSGANVICCARRAALLESTVAAIEAEGGAALAASCDVTDPASIAGAFDAAEKRFGVVDSAIVNAGINAAGPALNLSVADLDAVLAVNLRGAFLTAQEAARRMIAHGPADRPRRILFIASILAFDPSPGLAAYAATKAGLVMLAKSLAQEWARHEICVNAVCPGYMQTEIVGDWFETDAGKRQIAAWPRRRLMELESLGPPVRYLLSPVAASVTGTILTVDDGQSLG